MGETVSEGERVSEEGERDSVRRRRKRQCQNNNNNTRELIQHFQKLKAHYN